VITDKKPALPPSTDIDAIIKHIEHVDVLVHDEKCDPALRNRAVLDFFTSYTRQLIALLYELRQWRDQKDGGGALHASGTHRVVIEGFSDEGAEQALSSALDKAKQYFSEDRDISITLHQLIELPQGGHRATLELHLTPISLKLKPHLKAADIENKRNLQQGFDALRKHEAELIPHLVYDHFARSVGGFSSAAVPPYFLIHVTDANLMNFMIEREFFNAGHENKLVESSPALEENAPEFPKKFIVRLTPEESGS